MIINSQRAFCKCDWCGKNYKLHHSSSTSNPENWCSENCATNEAADVVDAIYEGSY